MFNKFQTNFLNSYIGLSSWQGLSAYILRSVKNSITEGIQMSS